MSFNQPNFYVVDCVSQFYVSYSPITDLTSGVEDFVTTDELQELIGANPGHWATTKVFFDEFDRYLESVVEQLKTEPKVPLSDDVLYLYQTPYISNTHHTKFNLRKKGRFFFLKEQKEIDRKEQEVLKFRLMTLFELFVRHNYSFLFVSCNQRSSISIEEFVQTIQRFCSFQELELFIADPSPTRISDYWDDKTKIEKVRQIWNSVNTSNH